MSAYAPMGVIVMADESFYTAGRRPTAAAARAAWPTESGAVAAVGAAAIPAIMASVRRVYARRHRSNQPDAVEVRRRHWHRH